MRDAQRDTQGQRLGKKKKELSVKVTVQTAVTDKCKVSKTHKGHRRTGTECKSLLLARVKIAILF